MPKLDKMRQSGVIPTAYIEPSMPRVPESVVISLIDAAVARGYTTPPQGGAS